MFKILSKAISQFICKDELHYKYEKKIEELVHKLADSERNVGILYFVNFSNFYLHQAV